MKEKRREEQTFMDSQVATIAIDALNDYPTQFNVVDEWKSNFKILYKTIKTRIERVLNTQDSYEMKWREGGGVRRTQNKYPWTRLESINGIISLSYPKRHIKV